jgi:serine protease Do
MNNKPFKPLLGLVVVMLVVGLACSLGGSSKATDTSVPATPRPTKTSVPPTEISRPPTETSRPPTDTPIPVTNTPAASATQSLAVSALADVKKAVIQIEAQGTFQYPDGTSFNEAGYGSGFIIDSSGLALTNNHVVTGAALLQVWIGGDRSRTYNAKVIGVSECSDLALIDLEGDGFQYLEWYEGQVSVGLEVYAAGFPLAEPEFTLTRGIISKERADGETSWASVDYVIMHDATINPGNSGGPLVDKDGKIVGINYAGNQRDQYFAISKDLAKGVANQLRSGNVDTIGVNGDAFILEDGSASGIWVYSVKSGSPADKAGVKGGDIIMTLESLVLATDGTMKDYCDVLRSHSANDTLGIEVYRYPTGEYLEGQINGRTMAVTGVYTGGGGDGGGGTDTGTYSTYVTVQDDTYTVQVDVPAEWSDIDGSTWSTTWLGYSFDAPSIAASADLNAYWNTYTESGVWFAASDELGQIGGFVQLLDGTMGWYQNDCTYDSRINYGEGDWPDPLYEGKFDLWTNCGGSGNILIILAARPKSNPTAFLILLEIRITKDADFDALTEILNSFEVVGIF